MTAALTTLPHARSAVLVSASSAPSESGLHSSQGFVNFPHPTTLARFRCPSGPPRSSKALRGHDNQILTKGHFRPRQPSSFTSLFLQTIKMSELTNENSDCARLSCSNYTLISVAPMIHLVAHKDE